VNKRPRRIDSSRDNDTFHTDELKSFQPRLRSDLPYLTPAPSGAFLVDALAAQIPWRSGVEPVDQVTFVRLALGRAWEDGRRARARHRGHRETRKEVRKGMPPSATWKGPTFHAVKQLDEAIAGFRKISLSVERYLTDAQEQNALGAVGRADQLGQRLGLESSPLEHFISVLQELDRWRRNSPQLLDEIKDWRRRLDAASVGVPGDKGHYELDAFIQALADWWFRNTGKRPAKTRTREPRKVAMTISFVDFAQAAWNDASGRAENIDRAVKRVLAASDTKRSASK
jgi:hypothetical protein